MARPIKDTPILKGKASKEFNKKLVKNADKRVPVSEINRISAVVKAVLEKSEKYVNSK